MSIESVQDEARHYHGVEGMKVRATLEVARQLRRVADTLEAIASPKALDMLERWATSPMMIYQTPDGDVTYKPTAPQVEDEPRIAEATCSRCGYRTSYYPEDADLPHGWAAVTGGGGLCGGCFMKVRKDREELIEELSFLYSEGVRGGVGIPPDRLTPDIGALADKIIEKMRVKPSWDTVAWMTANPKHEVGAGDDF